MQGDETNGGKGVLNGYRLVFLDDPGQALLSEEGLVVDREVLNPRGGVSVTHSDVEVLLDDVVKFVQGENLFVLL